MPIPDQIDTQVEQEIASVGPRDYLRTGRSYNDFLSEYTGIIAQVEEDKEPITGAGYEWKKMPKYIAYLEKIPKVQADRIVAEGDEADVVEEFEKRMPEAQKTEKLLMAMGRFILAQTEDADDKRVYDRVRDGYGYVDSLSDIVTMANFGRRHMDIVSQVSPGGQVIDKAYLNKVEKEALDLLKLKGAAEAASDDISKQVDRKNRLITLMVKAERDMKLYAEMAFFNNIEHYNKHYASESLRRKRNRAAGEEDVSGTPEEQAENIVA